MVKGIGIYIPTVIYYLKKQRDDEDNIFRNNISLTLDVMQCPIMILLVHFRKYV